MPEQVKKTEISQTIQDDPGLNIQRYLHVLLKRKFHILSVFIIVLSAIAVWTFSQTRIFRATASVLVEQKAPQVLGSQVNEVVDLSTGSFWRNKEYMETQRMVITSVSLARTVAEKLNLATLPTFWRPADTGSEKKSSLPTLERAAQVLQGLVTATPVRDSNIIEISIEHHDPNLAARLANTISEAYMDQNINYKLSSTSGAVKWLSDQLDDLKKQLESTEQSLYEFKKTHNIISLSLEDKQNILARQIEKITDSLTEIRMKRMSLDAQRKQVLLAQQESEKNDPLQLAVSPVLDNPVIQKLKEVYIEENRNYLALLEKYGDKHPLVKEQKAKVEAARHDLGRETKSVLDALGSKFQEIRDNERQIAAALQSAKDEAITLNKRELSYQRLKRTQENTAKLYGLVLTRMKESDLSSQLRVNNIRRLDAASVPKFPVRPLLKLNLLLGALMGLLLGIALAFLVDTLDNSVKSQDDVAQVPGLVFLGLLPKIPGSMVSKRGKRPDPKPELDLIVHRNPKSPVAESCRSIRTNILFASTDMAMKTIAVSSPGPKEGKTTTTVSVSIAMAQAGSRVVIVDTDMRRPRMHKIFGVPGLEGITSVLLGDGKLDDVIKSTEVPNLYILPCGPIPPNPAEICQSVRFKDLLKELEQRFDRVILDSPPVMVVTDAVVLSTMVHGLLLVVRTGQTTRGGLRETARQVQDVGGHLLGCVMNDMDLEKGGYGYYRYRRYGYYRYGYARYGYGHYGDKEETEGAGS